MANYVYKGFSTKQFQQNKTFVMTDMDLVNEDLINHIFTRKGERRKMAQFGTSIPDLIFEPLDSDIINQIYVELQTVFNYDPRVDLVDMVVIPIYDENAVVAMVDLFYVELSEKDRLSLRIEFNN